MYIESWTRTAENSLTAYVKNVSQLLGLTPVLTPLRGCESYDDAAGVAASGQCRCRCSSRRACVRSLAAQRRSEF